MEKMNLHVADYNALIQQKLALIPVDYLAHLYQIVSLMARPFEPEPEPEPALEPEPTPVVSIEDLEGYATYFTNAITTVLPESMKVNLKYQILDNELVLIELVTAEYVYAEELEPTQIDFELLLTENETTLEYVLCNAEKQTVMLFGEENLIICKTNTPTQWSQESAQADVRAVVSTLINHLPTYEEA